MEFLSLCSPFLDKHHNEEKSWRVKEATSHSQISFQTPLPGKLLGPPFTHTGDGKTGTYTTPAEATILHVQLWGAGGGGGGCVTSTDPNIYALGAGGGGGGYAEGYLFAPLQESYEFYIATGGLGGDGTIGDSAETSWFGDIDNVKQIVATGGSGGRTITSSIPLITLGALGGMGGTGGGVQAQIQCEGSSGGNSFYFSPYRYFFAGEGGSAPYASGATMQLTHNDEIVPITLPGTTGHIYGGGGSGSISVRQINTPVKGGDGATGFLTVTAFRSIPDKLSLFKVDSLSPADSGIFLTDPRARLLKIEMWGAGGGGGGCAPIGFMGVIAQGASGGGGGGYTETVISNPVESYNYSLAKGGEGGSPGLTGEPGLTSWFSNPAHLSASGGLGGGCGVQRNDANDSISAARIIVGGLGGVGCGSWTTTNIVGGQGGSGISRLSIQTSFEISLAVGDLISVF